MITCGVIGATGYGGAELVRILSGHPEVGDLLLASTSKAGSHLHAEYPSLLPGGGAARSLPALVPPAVACEADVVFSAGPAGFAEQWAVLALGRSAGRRKLFVDLSADFRFGADEVTYYNWYGKSYGDQALHAAAVYGLPELNRDLVRDARLVGNPGCYPTASTLALFPALRLGLAEREGIVIDAKSGATGAGREPARTSHYSDVADAVTPYKVGSHRHTPEIGAVLSSMAGAAVEDPVFTPHLAPMGRGIVSTAYFRLARPMTEAALRSAWKEFYRGEPFVRVLPEGLCATNRNVRLSNFCDVSVHLAHGGKLGIAIGAIDNMVKGAAGQAVQNMNIALGLDETAGLSFVPSAF